MKLRILDNSLRLRLDRSELVKLLCEGSVQRRADFGGSALVYALHAVPQASLLRATPDSGRIDVSSMRSVQAVGRAPTPRVLSASDRLMRRS